MSLVLWESKNVWSKFWQIFYDFKVMLTFPESSGKSYDKKEQKWWFLDSIFSKGFICTFAILIKFGNDNDKFSGLLSRRKLSLSYISVETIEGIILRHLTWSKEKNKGTNYANMCSSSWGGWLQMGASGKLTVFCFSY